MTRGGLLLVLAVLTASPVQSAALCHRYSVWKYPWPQRCSFGQKRVSVRNRVPENFPKIGIDMPLPFLNRADLTGGLPDEVTAARLQLMGYAYGH